MTKTAIAKNQSIPSTAVNQSTEMQTKALVNQPKPAKRHRIPAPQRIRVMELYALGKNQTQIAREEHLNRETVHKIVNGSEMGEFIEEMRSRFRGLSELAVEALRASLEQRGKEAIEIAWRVLETNGIIPPTGQAVNYSTQLQDASANEENEAVRKTLSAFGRIAMERARVFNCPMPELEEAAEQAGVRFEETRSG
jgi:hypothetical protein